MVKLKGDDRVWEIVEPFPRRRDKATYLIAERDNEENTRTVFENEIKIQPETLDDEVLLEEFEKSIEGIQKLNPVAICYLRIVIDILFHMEIVFYTFNNKVK